jgi:NAD(P)-dependent dehydrogenase (short-subunit alcohol dehydrogenase family)
MSGRIAIVVGAGGELGRATAKTLAGAGYTVIGVDRNEQGLAKLPTASAVKWATRPIQPRPRASSTG